MAPAALTLFGVRHRALIALLLAMLTLARKKMTWSGFAQQFGVDATIAGDGRRNC
jgi:hypothetical protein